MSYLIWIFVGFVSGFLASRFVNETAEGEFFDVALGIAGAAIAGLLFSAMEMPAGTGLILYGLLASVIGTVVLLVAYRTVFHRLRRAGR
jgi:uncharacterized membrane protein YeaQ/YmgE (transglycosylase-associated protein family)